MAVKVEHKKVTGRNITKADYEEPLIVTGTPGKVLVFDQDGKAAEVDLPIGGGGEGSNGKSAYELAVEEGFVGTKQEWIDSLAAPTPYELAVANGFVGTEAEWLLSLEGEPGPTPYELAVENGFVGTEEEWLASLAGPGVPTEGQAGQFITQDGETGEAEWTDLTWDDITGDPAVNAALTAHINALIAAAGGGGDPDPSGPPVFTLVGKGSSGGGWYGGTGAGDPITIMGTDGTTPTPLTAGRYLIFMSFVGSNDVTTPDATSSIKLDSDSLLTPAVEHHQSNGGTEWQLYDVTITANRSTINTNLVRNQDQAVRTLIYKIQSAGAIAGTAKMNYAYRNAGTWSAAPELVVPAGGKGFFIADANGGTVDAPAVVDATVTGGWAGPVEVGHVDENDTVSYTVGSGGFGAIIAISFAGA